MGIRSRGGGDLVFLWWMVLVVFSVVWYGGNGLSYYGFKMVVAGYELLGWRLYVLLFHCLYWF